MKSHAFNLQGNSGIRPPVLDQTGFTLLEILVAIVVLSLGLLGLAGLQAASLTNNQNAYFRSIATQQAYDMADRIRANLAGVAAGSYDALGTNTPANPGCIHLVAGCTAANVAVTDHSQWNTTNGRVLPNGQGSVDCVLGPGANCSNDPNAVRTFEITVQWTERTAGGNVMGAFVTRVTP